jgi:murein DD-endopeptidase MepM/ murein hydrolase activator NlpD
MINNVSQISSTPSLSGISTQASAAESSTADIISSFKEIMSSMMTTSSSGLSSDQQSSSGINDLMAPLMMIILLEKLLEGQIVQDQAEQAAPTAATGLQEVSLNQAQKSEPSGRPVGGVLTQEYHPGHNGLDFGIVVGTPVEATMDGKVISAGWNNQGYGNLVIVENGSYRTYYAHLSSIPVSAGDTVTAGTTIGLSGNTGNSTGPHLHYEIRKDNVPINPTSMTLGVST